jgi:1-acyl-sn-glycerol-3-phosphate acyltransferase
VNALLSIWMWFELGVIEFLGFWLQALVFLVTFPFDRRRYVAGRLFRRIGTTIATLSPFWKFEVVGTVVRPKRLTVCVSNHESQADPFLISHLPWEMKWLAKDVLFKIPFVGWSMWMAGDIPVKRGTSDSVKDAMTQCEKWLRKGMPVMIFPEGTRSTTADLLPFKDGAFRLAIQVGADVLPLAVSGTRKALPKHAWRFQKAHARVTVGTPISTQGMTDADVGRLKSMAREQIETLRNGLKKGLETA